MNVAGVLLVSLPFLLLTQAKVKVQGEQVTLNHPRINTQYGTVKGIRAVYKGQTYEAYRGIPYAQPPVGPLRWERPRQPKSWTGNWDATQFRQPCTQRPKPTPASGEDCLYINVYVPHGVKQLNLSSPVPVMVWTYGGSMLFGGADDYPAEDLALTTNTIIVSYNYRVSVLGGLSTSDSNSPGNYMLWDARAALLWVRDNIANFGGDSSRVTLFGQSAGAAIVSHLAVSPLVKGLFNRAIILSGGSTGPFGYQHRSHHMAELLAEVEGCPVGNTAKMVRCLKKRNAHALDRSGYQSSFVLGGRLPGWLPVQDGQIVPRMPRDAWSSGAANDIDLLIGRQEDDAAFFVFAASWGGRGEKTNLAANKELLHAGLRFLIQTYTKGDPQVLLNAIIQQYPHLGSTNTTLRTKAASQCGTEFIFGSSSHFEAESHARTSKKNTYMYNWHYRPSFVHYEPWVQGTHNDDLHLSFGEPFCRQFRKEKLGNFSNEDIEMKNNWMHYLANFAYTGNPNQGPHKVPVFWPKYDSTHKRLLEFAPKIVATKESSDLLQRLDFWLKEWPKITVPDQLDHQTKFEMPVEILEAFMKMVMH